MNASSFPCAGPRVPAVPIGVHHAGSRIPGPPPERAGPPPGPAARLAPGDLPAARIPRPGRPRGDAARCRERQVLYQFSARGHDFAQILLGLQLTDRTMGSPCYYRSRPVMLALGVELEEAAAGPLRAHRLLQRRSRHRRRVQQAGSGRSHGVARMWRRRGAVHAGGRLGSGDPLPRRGAAGRCVRAQHRRRAGWRRFGCHRRILVGAHDGHDAAPADAVLHRGQRLRHLGAIAAADAGRQHRGQPALVLGPDSPRRATAPIRCRPRSSGRSGSTRARGARAAAAAPDRAAALRALRPGYPGLQVARDDRRSSGHAIRCIELQRFLVPACSSGRGLDAVGRATRIATSSERLRTRVGAAASRTRHSHAAVTSSRTTYATGRGRAGRAATHPPAPAHEPRPGPSASTC